MDKPTIMQSIYICFACLVFLGRPQWTSLELVYYNTPSIIIVVSLLRNNARNGQPRKDSKVVVMDAMAFLQDLHDMHSAKWRPINSGLMSSGLELESLDTSWRRQGRKHKIS
nr:uncharacterized protein LOC111994426 [Quercus suber]POE73560.1 hypothetical protein CFP56_47800 [Quercus suber]